MTDHPELDQNLQEAPSCKVGEPESGALHRISFGEMLRGVRQSAGHSVESLAQTTRISQDFIRALEENRFADLPGKVFARGFVRSIAKAAGSVHADDLVGAFDRATSGSCAAGGHGAESQPQSRAEKRLVRVPDQLQGQLQTRLAAFLNNRRFRTWLGVGLIASAAIVVMFEPRARRILALSSKKITASVKFSGGTESPSREPTAIVIGAENRISQPANVDATDQPAQNAGATTVSAAAPVDTPVAVAQAVSDQSAATPSLGIAEPQGHDPRKSGRQILDIRVSAPVRIKIDMDGGGTEIRDLKPDAYRIEFQDEANLLIYDAGAVDLQFNGRSLGSLGQKGRVRRLSFRSGAPESDNSQ